jgi:hypothetical protein
MESPSDVRVARSRPKKGTPSLVVHVHSDFKNYWVERCVKFVRVQQNQSGFTMIPCQAEAAGAMTVADHLKEGYLEVEFTRKWLNSLFGSEVFSKWPTQAFFFNADGRIQVRKLHKLELLSAVETRKFKYKGRAA